MGYLLRAGFGAALFVASIVLFESKLLGLLETGTCASGNVPYQISKPCPEGTGTDIMLLTASVFGVMIGAAIFAFRGDRPGGSGRRWISGVGLWGIGFTGAGAATLAGVLGNDALPADGELGGFIVAGTFLFMGLPALLMEAWRVVGLIREPADSASAPGGVDRRSLPTHASSSAGSPSGWISSIEPAADAAAGEHEAEPGDVVDRLERLQKLRESGALTETEFQLQKSRILNG